jgi:hypothetical protein
MQKKNNWKAGQDGLVKYRVTKITYIVQYIKKENFKLDLFVCN